MASRLSRGHADFVQYAVDKALFYALFITFFVAVLLGVTNGWARGSTIWYSIGWAFFAVAVCCVEFGAVKKSVSEAQAGRKAMAVICGTAGVVAFFLSTFATFNSAATNLDQVGTALLAKEDRYRSTKDEANAAGAEVIALRNARNEASTALLAATPKVAGQDVTTVDGAQQLIAAAKSDRFWDRTDGCTLTKGKDTSKFCREYREAEAAVPALTARAEMQAKLDKLEEKLAVAEGHHREASAAAQAAPPSIDQRTPFTRLLVAHTGVPADVAPVVEAGLPSIGLQLLLMFLGLIVGGSAMRLDEDDQGQPGPGPGASGRRVNEPRSYTQAIESQRPLVINNRVEQPAETDIFGVAMERVRRREALAGSGFHPSLAAA